MSHRDNSHENLTTPSTDPEAENKKENSPWAELKLTDTVSGKTMGSC